jgi:hypothetical protein
MAYSYPQKLWKAFFFFAGKYGSTTKIFDSPLVLVFSYEPPDESKMKKNLLGWLISMFRAPHASIFHVLVEKAWIDYQLVSMQQSSFVAACVQAIPTVQINGKILTER